MERTTDYGVSIPSGYIYNTAPETKFQGTSQKMGQKDG